jgi:hypothetical protein
MRIPPFNEAGELPLGEHVTSLAAVKRRFGRSSAQRQKLMRGLEAAVENLRAAGVRRLWIDGSFVTRFRPSSKSIETGSLREFW